MSYELDYQEDASCPCGKGKIIRKVFSNDWNRSYDEVSIACDDCRSKYHIESISSPRRYKGRDTVYMVPLGESMFPRTVYNVIEIPYEEQLVMTFTISELEEIQEVLSRYTSASKVNERLASKAIKMCKSSSYKTTRLKVVREEVSVALKNYESYKYNFESESLRVKDVKERCIKVNI